MFSVTELYNPTSKIGNNRNEQKELEYEVANIFRNFEIMDVENLSKYNLTEKHKDDDDDIRKVEDLIFNTENKYLDGLLDFNALDNMYKKKDC